jgi:putative RNA 2'-phosphotransferase
MSMKTDRLSHEQIVKIKKMMAFMLRHKPFFYKIRLNGFGYAKTKDVTAAIKKSLKIENLTEDDIVIISKQFSGGIFEIKDDLVRARSGHTTIFNLNTPDGFIETSELPKELFCKLQSHDFIMDSDSKLILCNKSYIMTSASVKSELGYTIIKINTKKSSSKGLKFYSQSSESYFTPFVFSDSISIHVQ